MLPKLTSQWEGPCKLLEQLSDVVYWVRVHTQRHVVMLHRDRLVPYHPLATDDDNNAVEGLAPWPGALAEVTMKEHKLFVQCDSSSSKPMACYNT